MKDFAIQDEVLKGKSLLKGTSTNAKSSSNVYDDLCKVIKTTLTERPTNAVDLVEEYIDGRAPPEEFKETDTLNQNKTAEIQVNLFEKYKEGVQEDAGEQDEEFEIPIPNSLQMLYFFEQASIGLCREEMFKISLAMKYLVYNYPLSSARFWGKLFGTEKSYYIAEVKFREGEGEDESNEGDDDKEERFGKDREQDENSENGRPSEENNLPVSSWKPPPIIAKEDHHTGTNKYAYFVCNEPGEDWKKLPHVSPAEITAARRMSKYFTGNLTATISSYPPFPGNESNYLRAQIARISAATHISPTGYFVFDEDEEEEEEEEEIHDSYMINENFEGLSTQDLAHPSMASWAHHSQYILPQGRCTWFNPYEQTADDFEEEESDEEENRSDPLVIPETGPHLLGSVAEDKGIGHVPAWSTYLSSQVLPEYALAVARSNIWPGAFAIAKDKIFENIYIGWGRKYSLHPYAPPQPPLPLGEFPAATDIEEMLDPTAEDERIFREKNDAKKAAEDLEDLEDDEDDD